MHTIFDIAAKRPLAMSMNGPLGRPDRQRRVPRLLVSAHRLAQRRHGPACSRPDGRTHRAVARRRGYDSRARRPLSASRRAALARPRQRQHDRVPVSRYLDRRRRPHRERSGAARLSDRRPPRACARMRCEEIAGAIFAYFPTPAGEAPPPLDPPAEFTDPAWSHFVCETTWNTQLPLRDRERDRPDARAVSARRFAHDDGRRERRRHGDHRHRPRFPRLAQTAEGRRVRLDRVRRNRRALDAARHPLSGEERTGRPVSRDRLRDADRRTPRADLSSGGCAR